MTATRQTPPVGHRTWIWLRAARWSAAAAVLIAAPKCLMCLMGYAAVASVAGAELCGSASAPFPTAHVLLMFSLLLLAVVVHIPVRSRLRFGSLRRLRRLPPRQ